MIIITITVSPTTIIEKHKIESREEKKKIVQSKVKNSIVPYIVVEFLRSK